ncbi:bifunctional 23S rRNA (guanine(2069)-N(7))-methyltransferase RlmK/23S rRNA (guanine(2445)-N(2))-methyltransferase RlmL [Natronospirillum operosum]|uniref:Ribosomal RNA large subunit methyltransferase K/L n=1 Tax=Natronospirillum operosum TaxID=2759953 RepID=A0A4Z0WCZ2_9GAMM|nr:bifunctional 23S rRNA (guanine(2069)-N(7))-methyltransferase RlmK/23S rRNA (guanine(2445)-N(2))-methyltransferase RlmL [Natronospirillum operosum]TGG95734.1 bifunctional 23S rRNA (guanine(2069)-N(7))-methyltransferase RlmK/23S rRNA (guanine(2445)-N(2))-methyltransferase RlmL [Natronospirillum operosum]
MHLITDDSTWFVACARNLEPLLADELLGLGAEAVRPGRAGAHFKGDLAVAYRVVLWSRLASRITLQLGQARLGRGKALSSSAADVSESPETAVLTELLRVQDWAQHMRPEGTLKVRFNGRSDTFRNSHFGAQWVKDQIVDVFRERTGVRPSVSDDPDLTVVVTLHRNQVQLGVELTGRSLHAREYRPQSAAAPLRESLAAALLQRAGWHDWCARAGDQEIPEEGVQKVTLIDPMCGSGTLLLEAALIAFDWAPGLLRTDSLNARWPGHDEALWQSLVEEARTRRDLALQQRAEAFEFWGNDRADVVFAQARQSWRELGLPEARWTQADIRQMPAHPETGQGLVIVNPPYGERLGADSDLATLYRALGDWMQQLPARFSGAVLLPETADARATGLFYNHRHAFMNGQLACALYRFDTLQPRETREPQVIPDLANRLRKNQRRLKAFVRSDVTDAYRLYDADLPEYAIAVDRYGDWLHVQEYAPPATIEPALARRRLEDAVATLSATLEVPAARISLKQRRPQKGSAQYQRQDQTGQTVLVREHGVRAEVNLFDYLDTGLFLDHRPARFWIQQHSRNLRVLNLFCYTGMASVHAAVGGARRVDSVDLSATYLDWARRNFAHNGLAADRHGFHRADVLVWLAEQNAQWDLIFLDPPTFSNSARMNHDFDVQRDQAHLLQLTMARLAPDGVLLFSNNFRRFRLAEEVRTAYAVEDWHQASIPPDFQRRSRIHQCWQIRHP